MCGERDGDDEGDGRVDCVVRGMGMVRGMVGYGGWGMQSEQHCWPVCVSLSSVWRVSCASRLPLDAACLGWWRLSRVWTMYPHYEARCATLWCR